MRTKHFGLGLLAALFVVSAGGCKKSGSAASPPQSLNANSPPVTLARVHWLGKTRIAAETNAARFLSLWDLPASAALERQTLDKLALALAGVSQATNIDVQPPGANSWELLTNYHAMGTNYALLVARHPVAARLRPLLANLVSQEWYLGVQQATNQPGEVALAIRLDAPQAALWTSNLSAVLGSLPNVQSLPASTNARAWQLPSPLNLGSPESCRRFPLSPSEGERAGVRGPSSTSGAPPPRPSHLVLARAGDWTLVGLAGEHNTLLYDFAARIQRGQTPLSAPETGASLQMDRVTRKVGPAPGSPVPSYWLEAALDPPRIDNALALGWDLPADLPKVSLALTGDKQGVRTRANLDFPDPLPLEMEAWNIPTNLIHDPIIGFAAVRGIRPWLKSFKPWNELQLGTPPNQAYFWAQGGPPFLHFLAAPSADASNQVNHLIELVLRDLNPILATNGWPGAPLCGKPIRPASYGGESLISRLMWTTRTAAAVGSFSRAWPRTR